MTNKPKKWDMGDPLEAAIYKVCETMVGEEWTIRDGGEFGMPDPDEFFPSTMRRHFRPLARTDGYKKARIAALRAEIEALESDL